LRTPKRLSVTGSPVNGTIYCGWPARRSGEARQHRSSEHAKEAFAEVDPFCSVACSCSSVAVRAWPVAEHGLPAGVGPLAHVGAAERVAARLVVPAETFELAREDDHAFVAKVLQEAARDTLEFVAAVDGVSLDGRLIRSRPPSSRPCRPRCHRSAVRVPTVPAGSIRSAQPSSVNRPFRLTSVHNPARRSRSARLGPTKLSSRPRTRLSQLTVHGRPPRGRERRWERSRPHPPERNAGPTRYSRQPSRCNPVSTNGSMKSPVGCVRASRSRPTVASDSEPKARARPVTDWRARLVSDRTGRRRRRRRRG
jgi:hypothetical protein